MKTITRKWIITKCLEHNPCLALKEKTKVIEHFAYKTPSNADRYTDCDKLIDSLN